jgi:hypothetical protein
MGVVEGVGPARPARRDAHAGVADTASIAWLLALPCALVVALAILALGPPLGRLLHSGGNPYRFWRELRWAVIPEPTEQGRFLISLGAPLLLAGATVGAVRRSWQPSARLATVGVPLAQALGIALVVACVVAQLGLRFEVPIYPQGVVHKWRYFTPATYVAALLLAGGAWLALARPRAHARLAALVRETPPRRAAAIALAVALTAIWLLHAINTDATIIGTSPHEYEPAGFTLDETYAVVNGRTPLVDFTAQYGSLWPYPLALALVVFGKTFLVLSIAMAALSAAALLAVFAILRRVTRNAVSALALYLPFLATAMFKVGGTSANRYTFGDYWGMFPLRYAGPYLLAWLTARGLDGARSAAAAGGPESGGPTRRLRAALGPARPWVLFAAAGLVLLNNLELGIAALGATLAALLWGSPAPSWRPRALGRLAGELLAGLLAAYAGVALLTLARAGALPDPGRLLDYARMYAVGGFGLLPLPGVLGLHLVVYLTYVGALGVATVRALDRAEDRTLTGMLAWCGAFGLGSASWYMGRTHPEALIAMFGTWALTIALLSVVIVRDAPRRLGLASLAVLFALGLTICSLAQVPWPWTQLDRLRAGTPSTPIQAEVPIPPFRRAFMPDPATRTFFASLADGPGRFVVRQGAPVAILLTTGHEIANAFGVVDVSRYTGMYSILTRERMKTVVADLRAAGGNTLFVPATYREVYELLAQLGFEPLTPHGLAPFTGAMRESELRQVQWGSTTVTKWVDTRHLHPRALAARQ